MSKPIDRDMKLPIEYIEVPEEEKIDDPFVTFQLAKAQYLKNGYRVLMGLDFEENIIINVSPEDKLQRLLLDDYNKIKLHHGKKTVLIQDYGNQIKSLLGEEKVKQLLHICRMCTFLGGPGFPELIMIKPDENTFFLAFTNPELLLEQRMFYLLAKELDICEIKLITTKTSTEVLKDVSFNIKEFLEEVSTTDRFQRFMHDLNDLISKETNEDEKAHLEAEKHTMPFYMLNSWLEKGETEKEDILDNMKRTQDALNYRKEHFMKFIRDLASDEKYKEFGVSQNVDVMKQKHDYFMQKFSLGDSRATEFLKFVSSL